MYQIFIIYEVLFYYLDMEILNFDGHKEIPETALQSARLYANRHQMLLSLDKNKKWVEVGVAFGDLSEFIIQNCTPKVFIGIDIFGWEKLETAWGKPVKDTLGTKSHENFFKDRLQKLGEDYRVQVETVNRNSWEALSNLNDVYDFIYIDAAHDYESVLKDTNAAIEKLSDAGVLIFNDYTWRDNVNGEIYGIVPVVNGLLSSGKWKIEALALHPLLFCDIAIRRC